MKIHNRQSVEDRLVSATTEVAEVVELHTTKMEGGMHRMEQVPFIAVPPNGMVELRPRGLHIMLIRLKQPLRVGDSFSLTLRFDKAGRVTVQVPVREPAEGGGGHGH